MTIEYAFQQGTSEQNWLWLPGWGFEAELFASLAQQIPGHHHWYRWDNVSHFEDAVERLHAQLPNQCTIVGWSLGGAIAEAVAHMTAQVSCLLTLATPPRFCRAETWPYGMPQERFEDFISSYKISPAKTLRRFLALTAQGTNTPKNVIRLLSHHQRPPSDELATQLLWLDQYDFTALPKAKCQCLHLFAEHDALVAPPHSHGQGRYELIPGTCHALFLQQPDIIVQHLQSFITVD